MTRRLQYSPAFTLIELMISIALVVILMVGITKVFSLTSQTAGATNQVSSALRDARATQAELYQDLSTAVTDDAPCMLLCSSRISAFRNKADEQSDRDGNPMTIDLDGNNTEGDTAVPGEVISPATYNFRSHRTDSFSFFSRQRLQRQTGGLVAPSGSPTAPLMGDMSSGEAWIWYGHLQLPDNNGSFTAATFPGTAPLTTNPNNYYATQWILGREAMLLRTKDTTVAPPRITDRKGNSQAFIDAPPMSTAAPAKRYLEPLAYSSGTNAGAGTYTMQQSRYDLAATSVDDFRERLTTWFNNTTNSTTDNWWGDLFCDPSHRYQANPFITNPITSAGFAQQAAIFLPGCTQFIVEYAGDFVAQNPATGQVTNVYTNANGTDGQIDFIITADGNTPANMSKKIRWYGLPRDVDGITGAVSTGAPDGRIVPVANAANIVDVVPLRDVWRTSTTPGAAPYATFAPFEKFTWTQDTNSGTTPAVSQATVKDVGTGGDYLLPTAGMTPNDYYICAFGPKDPKPKMIRITLTIDDPASKLADGKTFQFVFTLP